MLLFSVSKSKRSPPLQGSQKVLRFARDFLGKLRRNNVMGAAFALLAKASKCSPFPPGSLKTMAPPPFLGKDASPFSLCAPEKSCASRVTFREKEQRRNGRCFCAFGKSEQVQSVATSCPPHIPRVLINNNFF